MKKIILMLLLISSGFFVYAKVGIPIHTNHYVVEKIIAQNSTKVFSNDPCLNQALIAMNNAFSLSSVMIDWCWSINTTAQGYSDCSQFWIDWRRTVVADIYATMTSCPEETFNGSQTKAANHNSK